MFHKVGTNESRFNTFPRKKKKTQQDNGGFPQSLFVPLGVNAPKVGTITPSVSNRGSLVISPLDSKTPSTVTSEATTRNNSFVITPLDSRAPSAAPTRRASIIKRDSINKLGDTKPDNNSSQTSSRSNSTRSSISTDGTYQEYMDLIAEEIAERFAKRDTIEKQVKQLDQLDTDSDNNRNHRAL